MASVRDVGVAISAAFHMGFGEEKPFVLSQLLFFSSESMVLGTSSSGGTAGNREQEQLE